MIEIPLTRGYVALIDDIDSDLAALNWHTKINTRSLYAKRSLSKKGIRFNVWLHRVILERMLSRPLATDEVVDHINGDGLDNRRENLRVATNTQNVRNQRKRIDSTSGYKGVYFDKWRGQWKAMIRVNGQRSHIGYFDTPEKAYEAYCEAARKYHGEFARFE